MKKTFLLFALLTLSMPMWAQEEEGDVVYDSNYARRISLEVNGGLMWNLNGYRNQPATATGFMGGHELGGGFQVRGTMFVNKHWGAFLSAELSTIYDNDFKNFHHRNSSDYDYRFTYYWTDSYSGVGCFGDDAAFNRNGPRYHQALTGVTYRYDFDRHWSLRPRLGIGYRWMDPDGSFFYARWDKSLTKSLPKDSPTAGYNFMSRPSDFEEIHVEACDKNNNVLHGIGSIVIAPSIQICYTPRRTVFFSFEAQWTGTMRRFYERISLYDVHQETKHLMHSNEWQELNIPDRSDNNYIVVVESDDRTQYDWYNVTLDKKLRSQESHRVSMGNFLNLRIGVGWNIGRSRKY